MQSSTTAGEIASTIAYVGKRVKKLPPHITREDLDQQVAMIHLLTVGKKFPTVEDFHEEVLNKTQQWLGQEQGAETENLDDHTEVPTTSNSPEAICIARDGLSEGLGTLTPTQRQIVSLRFGTYSRSRASVADELGISSAAIEAVEEKAKGLVRSYAMA